MARAIRKQTVEVKERWARLKDHVGGWQNQVEKALERLQDLQSSMDQLDLRLTRAEEAKASWQPVGDLLIDSLQDHIDNTIVSQMSVQEVQIKGKSCKTNITLIPGLQRRGGSSASGYSDSQ